MSRTPSVVAALLAAAAIAACGDDDGGSAGDDAGEFRAAVGRLCTADTKAAERYDTVPASDRRYAANLEGLLEINARSRGRFADLEPPEELRAAYRDFLRANDAGVELARRIVARLEAGEERKKVLGGDTGRRLLEIGRQRAEAAQRLGTPECGGAEL